MHTQARSRPDRSWSTRRRPRQALPVVALTLSAVSYGVVAAPVVSAAGLTCFDEVVTIQGSGGKDEIIGTADADVIWGGGGDDVIEGAGGGDIICGGGGHDKLWGSDEGDLLDGGDGNDRLEGGDGTGIDMLTGGKGTNTFIADSPGTWVTGGPGVDNVRGKGVEMAVVGDAGDDNITIRGSLAEIEGGGGIDTITLTAAPSYLDGGAGNDTITTGDMDDGTVESPVMGGPGRDTITTGGGSDVVTGGAGPDTIDLGGGSGGYADGGDGIDVMKTGEQESSLSGGLHGDTLTANARDVMLVGGDGIDTLLGSRYPDALYGGDDGDYIYARGGDDVDVSGEGGDDTISGDGGVDVLYGEDGRDTMDTGAGSVGDVMYGEDGKDVLHANSPGGRAEGGAGDDELYAMAESVVLLGDGDNDLLTSDFGGPARTIFARGGDGVDTLVGAARDDELHGGAGNDTLNGKGGNDLLYGEEDIDVCSGGGGTDMCDGGPLGTPAPSPDDPDTCKADVEKKFNCRDASGFWGGTADGTLAHGNGVTETWGATYSMNPVSKGYYYAGDASIHWRISGTDKQGCTYDGAGNVPGRAELTTWTDDGSYFVSVHPNLGSHLPVTIDCPDKEPETEDFIVMNTDAAEGDGPLPEELPYRTLAGSAEYQPMNGGPDSWVSWTWSITRN